MKKNKNRARISSGKVKAEAGESLPGYPYYPSRDDIMNPANGLEKRELLESAENTVRQVTHTESTNNFPERIPDQTYLLAEEGTDGLSNTAESDVTNAEKQFLESDQLSEDMGEDEELRARVWSLDMSGADLDLPGTQPGDSDELSEADEENNFYSIGGDRHEEMEEEHDPGR